MNISDNQKVSFILPAYKRRFLREAIASILAQTYRDFELVVVDDCSPEDLKSLVDEFHDERMTYYRNETNIGGKDLIAAWNKAMTYARAEWCVLASDDDVYLPRYLEEMMRLKEKYPTCDLFHSWIDVVDANGALLCKGFLRAEFESLRDMVEVRGVKRAPQTLQEYMFRRSALERIGGFVPFPLAWFSDEATWMVMSKNGVVCAQEALFHWRVSNENISARIDCLSEKVHASALYKRWLRRFLVSCGWIDLFRPISNWTDSWHLKHVDKCSGWWMVCLLCHALFYDIVFSRLLLARIKKRVINRVKSLV